MEKKIEEKKLVLKKVTMSKLNDQQSEHVRGGGHSVQKTCFGCTIWSNHPVFCDTYACIPK